MHCIIISTPYCYGNGTNRNKLFSNQKPINEPPPLLFYKFINLFIYKILFNT